MWNQVRLVVLLMAALTAFGIDGHAGDEPNLNVVSIQGTTGKSQQLTIDELRKRPRTEIQAMDRKGQPVKYAGVAVMELLKEAGTAHGESLRGECLRAFVTVDARDDYRAVFALAEFDADFTDRVIILAYEKDGQPLDEKTGPFQIIVPGEKKHARWVRMVKEIRVLDSRWIKEVMNE